MLRYAAAIFLSAFLLFQVQPLIGKQILPWFGGTPAVWTTAMVFFQVLLLGGYAYSHLLIARLGRRGQVAVHLTLLAAALALAVALVILPVSARTGLRPTGAENPAWLIVALLTVTIGLPYFLLSTTGPLLQAWFSRTNPGASPYWLYALSNVGSLLALLSYPFLVEPALTLRAQTSTWSGTFAVFVVVCGYCAVRTWPRRLGTNAECRMPNAESTTNAECPHSSLGIDSSFVIRHSSLPGPAWATGLLWVALPACGSLLLLAVTNQMCQDVAVVPFLWVLPLSLYLLSFILCFGFPGLYDRPIFWPLLVGAVALMVWLLYRGSDAGVGRLLADVGLAGAPFFRRWANVGGSIETQVVGYGASLFVCCLVCHGELVRLRPSPKHLTAFYLATAAGGALGGLFVGVAAPAIFPIYLELHVGIFACCVLAMAAFWHHIKPHRRWLRSPLTILWAPAFIAVLIFLGWELWGEAERTFEGAIWLSRNFYGTLRVAEGEQRGFRARVLEHGRIVHGWQTLDASRRRVPLAYFSAQSGVGRAFAAYPRQGPLRVGVIGLGAGVLAAYGQKGDHFTFYEINPAVEQVAESRFTYLKDMRDAGGACDVVLGDARLSLASRDSQQFDLFALDAFSGDAIPVHLLTQEAFAIYLSHLKPDGVMALHITNHYLDLCPVVLAEAAAFGLHAAVIRSAGAPDQGIAPATWVLMSRNDEVLSRDPIRQASSPPSPTSARIRLWTDDYSNLFQILK